MDFDLDSEKSQGYHQAQINLLQVVLEDKQDRGSQVRAVFRYTMFQNRLQDRARRMQVGNPKKRKLTNSLHLASPSLFLHRKQWPAL